MSRKANRASSAAHPNQQSSFQSPKPGNNSAGELLGHMRPLPPSNVCLTEALEDAEYCTKLSGASFPEPIPPYLHHMPLMALMNAPDGTDFINVELGVLNMTIFEGTKMVAQRWRSN